MWAYIHIYNFSLCVCVFILFISSVLFIFCIAFCHKPQLVKAGTILE